MTVAQQRRTRLAPSPTGALHLGNARTFLINWALARQNGWSILLRIEDLDGPRVKPGAIDDTLAILDWLGLDWDEGPITQSDDLEPYRAAMRQLAEAGNAYPCELTRREIELAASAPQDGCLLYTSSASATWSFWATRSRFKKPAAHSPR